MTVATYFNPGNLPTNPAYTQVVRVSAGADTIYVGGQNGVDGAGRLVGTDLKSQARQAFTNVQSCLRAAGASIEHVVKWTILVQEGEPLQDGFAAYREVWGQRPNPPALTVARVSGLAVPGALVEIDAVAAVPAS
ncbi:RidA family protein [Nocardia transvalensis]|uniref:RidA family protein n=1 Tax=Nocardia transvalensis TaxID=37333 RepID=UPI0018935776|nr:RidA family protein [Nocardia transvalensis]MBF6330504.1 RidA family protein [Nocardia transvalensis]